MKPFDLEKALTGEPVKLRNGSKAMIYACISNICTSKSKFPLKGILYSKDGEMFIDKSHYNWTIEGKFLSGNEEDEFDIIGMWEEPRPTVTLTLPCPLKEQRDEMWFISNSFRVQKSSYGSQSDMLRTDKESFRLGHYFATEEDAQAWLDAMRNSSR